MESFILPEKFEAMLGIRKCSTKRDRHTVANFVSRISFENQHISKTVGIETIRYEAIFLTYLFRTFLYRYDCRYNNAIEMAPCISSCTESTAKQCNTYTPFSTSIMVRLHVSNIILHLYFWGHKFFFLYMNYKTFLSG